MKNKITIATRESLLALWQAHYVENRLKEQYPGLSVELLPVTTKGDQILDRPLVEIGGKGLFIKELEVILLEKKADIAVHSLKDMTAKCPDGLTIAAVTKREDPRDAFVSNTFKSLDELPRGARVGTSSLRRQAQLLHWRPDLTIRSLRGNVQTRLRHLDEGDFDAVILAAAGLKRLGLGDRITSYISTEDSIPAAGQGVMAVEARSDDRETLDLLSFLHDEKVASCIRAERSFLARVGGDCKVPAGIYAVPEKGHISVKAFIASPDGKKLYRGSTEGPISRAEDLGSAMAGRLLDEGGRAVLEKLQKI
ncbi:hydroxymethylbilane synthase [uncultured Dialister sp.]|uniref:hydroxymethylbilane synthase n=1 Tax=uncultured Dialister sp. TaxID=278064 RepID=UPI00258FBE42|nr:hydroxymethylbilane synthase [uncultured Dialister sp.]